MERAIPPGGLNGSALVRLLAQWGVCEGLAANGAPRASFVEGLGRWLGWTDAIPLHAALSAEASADGSAMSSALAPAANHDGSAEFAQLRAALTRSITEAGGARGSGRDARRAMVGADGMVVAPDIEFTPYRQRYLGHQRAMDVAIATLRSRLREALVARGPQPARLVTLDTVMEHIVGARERSLLEMLPTWLERRFDRLRRAERGDGPADAPVPAGPWLDGFEQDMQRLLLAELELRLQPAQGLLDALRTTPITEVSDA